MLLCYFCEACHIFKYLAIDIKPRFNYIKDSKAIPLWNSQPSAYTPVGATRKDSNMFTLNIELIVSHGVKRGDNDLLIEVSAALTTLFNMVGIEYAHINTSQPNILTLDISNEKDMQAALSIASATLTNQFNNYEFWLTTADTLTPEFMRNN